MGRSRDVLAVAIIRLRLSFAAGRAGVNCSVQNRQPEFFSGWAEIRGREWRLAAKYTTGNLLRGLLKKIILWIRRKNFRMEERGRKSFLESYGQGPAALYLQILNSTG
jgi:hypothetical protein